MWIFLTKKLPTEVSPPKLSMFWSEPWVDRVEAARQLIGHQRYHDDGTIPQELDRIVDVGNPFGFEHNEAGARAILYKGEKIRVYPDEYSIPTAEGISLYVFGESMDDETASHEFVAYQDAQAVPQHLLEAAYPLADAAQLDGMSQGKAWVLAVMGLEPEQAAAMPAVGWFRCRREYAEIYCDEWEMKE